MEDEIRSALDGKTEDVVLVSIINIVLDAINTKRNLFSNPLTEPVILRRYLLPIIDDGLDELSAGQNALELAQQVFQR